MTYTTEWFRDKLKETALDKYKEHFYKYGREEATPVDLWLQYHKDELSDSEWIHELGDEYEEDFSPVFAEIGEDYHEEFCNWIDIHIEQHMDEIEDYIDNQMSDYAESMEYRKDPEKYLGYPY